MPDEQRRAQDFIENSKDQMMPWIVDVRDIGRAHVLAAEVGAHAGEDFSGLCLHAHLQHSARDGCPPCAAAELCCCAAPLIIIIASIDMS